MPTNKSESTLVLQTPLLVLDLFQCKYEFMSKTDLSSTIVGMSIYPSSFLLLSLLCLCLSVSASLSLYLFLL